ILVCYRSLSVEGWEEPYSPAQSKKRGERRLRSLAFGYTPATSIIQLRWLITRRVAWRFISKKPHRVDDFGPLSLSAAAKCCQCVATSMSTKRFSDPARNDKSDVTKKAARSIETVRLFTGDFSGRAGLIDNDVINYS